MAGRPSGAPGGKPMGAAQAVALVVAAVMAQPDEDDRRRFCPHGELWTDPCRECEYDAEDGRETLW